MLVRRQLRTGCACAWLQVFHLPLRVQGVAELKATARKFLAKRWEGVIEHGFSSNDDLSASEGPCWLHGQECQCRGDVDLATAGLPCLPFSNFRYKAGQTRDTRAPELHSAYSSVMEKFFAYVRNRHPKCIWLEEVLSFNHRSQATGRSHLDVFLQELKSCGYATHVL